MSESPSATQIEVRDLLLLPCPPAFGGGAAGANTVVLLPDRESTMTVSGCSDERWRSWNGRTINVWATLHGPAAQLTTRELFNLLPGCRSIARPGRSGVQEIGFDEHTSLALLRALVHSCDAEPGHRCDRPWWRGPCTSPASTAVDVAEVLA